MDIKTTLGIGAGVAGVAVAGYMACKGIKGKGEEQPEYLRDPSVQKMIKAVALENFKEKLKKFPANFSDLPGIQKALSNEWKAVIDDPNLMNDPAIQHEINEFDSNKEKRDLEYYRTDTSRFQDKIEMTPQSFLTALSRVGFLRGFNSRVHIVEPSNRELKIFTTSKPWFFQKLFAKPVSEAEKIATVKNLASLIMQKQDMIQLLRLDTQGIKANLEKLSTKITRNMSSEKQSDITRILTPVFAKLDEIGAKIKKDKEGDWLSFFGRIAAGAWWATKNTAVLTGKTVALAAKGTWWTAKNTVLLTAKAVGGVAGFSLYVLSLPFSGGQSN